MEELNESLSLLAGVAAAFGIVTYILKSKWPLVGQNKRLRCYETRGMRVYVGKKSVRRK